MQIWKYLAVIEAIIIIVIFATITLNQKEKTVLSENFLSPRISSGILKPESRLIFNFQPLEKSLEQYISHKNATIGIYVMNLRDGASMGINEETEFEPASLNKLPLAILVLREVEKKGYTLQKELLITKENADERSGQLYKKVGEYVTLKELLHEMLANSDNTAANALYDTVNKSDWEALSNYLNYYNLRKNENNTKADLFYTTTPEANGRIFTSLYLSTLLNAEHSELILEELNNTTFDINGLANLPQNLSVVEKFGTYYDDKNRDYHDCGIFYFNGGARFFYCVMTNGAHSQEAQEIIGETVHRIYTYITEAGQQIKEDQAL